MSPVLGTSGMVAAALKTVEKLLWGRGGGQCNGPGASPGSLMLQAHVSHLTLALPAQPGWKFLKVPPRGL